MSTRSFLQFMRSPLAKALALAFVFFPVLTGKTYAATDWSAIQSALNTNGTMMPGNVLRFELARHDLTESVNGQALNSEQGVAVNSGFIAFKPTDDDRFFVDGALPAQETEVAALQAALRKDARIHITAVVSHIILESPRLVWVHFEAEGDGAGIAASLAAALKTIQSPQLNVLVIPGTDTVFNPASILPPKFLALFNQGFIEQLDDTFAFYLPRPDEKEIFLGNVRAEPGLGVGQTFHIQVDFSGGANVTLNIDFALRAQELQPVEDALRTGGFTITSQSSEFVNDRPDLYFVHAAASGDGFSLGNTLYDVIQIIQADSSMDGEHDRDHH